jgi:beta-glucosidase
MSARHTQLPEAFHFGAATSAYQIEGAVQTDGRGVSMWDTFAHQRGHIADHSTGDVACDHYHRSAEDIALMKALGHNAYRFSVAWPRVMPSGRGAVNAAGLDFYDRLVDQLLAQDIAPYATLYHWDLPQALQDHGGWLNRDTCHAFAEYAEVVARRLGDRVHSYATLNEPRCSATVGYLEGRHAPGFTDRTQSLQVAHHLMLAHGLAIPAMRRWTQQAKLGIVLDMKPYYPANDSSEALSAARLADGVFNRWFLDPLFLGHYPTDVWEAQGPYVPQMKADDLETIRQPLDTLGINYYTRGWVDHDPGLPFPHAREQAVEGATYTTMGWEIYPDGLRDTLTHLSTDYPIADLYVAETGAALNDTVVHGEVHDPVRIEYLRGHLDAASDALAAGVPLSAFLVWSLMDNFEWGKGYTQRFGLVHVDFDTQVRTPKASALWLCDYLTTRQRLADAKTNS